MENFAGKDTKESNNQMTENDGEKSRNHHKQQQQINGTDIINGANLAGSGAIIYNLIDIKNNYKNNKKRFDEIDLKNQNILEEINKQQQTIQRIKEIGTGNVTYWFYNVVHNDSSISIFWRIPFYPLFNLIYYVACYLVLPIVAIAILGVISGSIIGIKDAKTKKSLLGAMFNGMADYNLAKLVINKVFAPVLNKINKLPKERFGFVFFINTENTNAKQNSIYKNLPFHAKKIF